MTADTEKILAFCEKWTAEFMAYNVQYAEKYLGDACAALGFVMDCGKALEKIFPGAMSGHEQLAGCIREIHDVQALQNAIYSQWRYFQHTACFEWDPAWFVLALDQLAHELIRQENLLKNAETVSEKVKIAGTFAAPHFDSAISRLKTGMPLELRRERENPHDKNAVAVWGAGYRIGWLPRKLAQELAPQMDENICIFAVVSGLSRKNGEIFADLFRRKLIPMDEITSIEYKMSGGFQPWPAESIRCRLSVCRGKFIHERILEGVETHRFEIVFSGDKWFRVCEKVKKCNFLAWNRNYFEPLTCDAADWSVCVRTKGKHVYRFAGNVRFPEEWEIFQSLLFDCSDLSEIHGNGSFRIIPCITTRKYGSRKKNGGKNEKNGK